SYHIGAWGDPYSGGGQPGKGVTAYAMSPNRQNPFAGVIKNGIFNVFRRSMGQVLYVVPPFIVAYSAMQWAIERNEYLNSKHGRAEFADEE
ncbi:ubiquinol-cytochrome c reductase complex ubiquinone-binding protein-like protein, partial [Amniculicola lignicola CBS 123094]